MKNGVKTDVLHGGNRTHGLQVAAVGIAQRQGGAPGPEDQFPKVREGPGCGLGIDGNGLDLRRESHG